MSKVTLKQRLGNYFFNRYWVPMKTKDGKLEKFKDGRLRLRHVKSFKEFLKYRKHHMLIER